MQVNHHGNQPNQETSSSGDDNSILQAKVNEIKGDTLQQIKLLLYCIIEISHLKLQCCHGNFSKSAKMTPRFENVTDYECNLSLMILVANHMVYF